jgi:hypothetical protein
VSDDELRATSYAELWLAELGAVVPEHRSGEVAEAPRPAPELRRAPAPHPTRPDRRA